jgi:hypothetical protein
MQNHRQNHSLVYFNFYGFTFPIIMAINSDFFLNSINRFVIVAKT